MAVNIEKVNVQKKSDKKKQRKPFKVCFVIERELGRSYFRVEKPLKAVIPLAPKFHTNRGAISDGNVEQIIDTLKILDLHEKYRSPLTENQRYGWYKLNIDKPDGRLNFGKRMQQMTKENLMNFEKIREY